MWRKKRKTLLLVAGGLYALFGILAFFNIPGGHDEHHHTFAHNITHIVLGVFLLLMAARTSASTRQIVCFSFTAAYLVIGAAGLLSPKSVTLTVLPGLIEFHAGDYGVHLATAFFFFVLGALKPSDQR